MDPSRRAQARGDRLKLITLAGAVAAITACGAVALSSHAVAGVGGVDPPPKPSLDGVRCLETCAGERKATIDSKVELFGRRLGGVTTVKFSAADGTRIPVAPLNAEARSVTARVPEGTVTGKPRVVDNFGNGDRSPENLIIVAADQIPEPGEFKLRSADARPNKVFFAGKRDPRVDYVFDGSTTDVRIRVVDRVSEKIVADFRQDAQEPFIEHTAIWNGRDDQGNLIERGRFKFKIGPASSGQAEATSESRFNLYSHKFPVRGRHSYGDGFGAGRNHKGQDVFARCGTPLEAARAGEVQWKAYQASGAGYYVVIDGRSDNRDYVYMHLKGPATVREGENVKTGEQIGKVGATGNASGCHLHFEYWSNDWFNGGRALSSATKKLRQWDGWS